MAVARQPLQAHCPTPKKTKAPRSNGGALVFIETLIRQDIALTFWSSGAGCTAGRNCVELSSLDSSREASHVNLVSLAETSPPQQQLGNEPCTSKLVGPFSRASSMTRLHGSDCGSGTSPPSIVVQDRLVKDIMAEIIAFATASSQQNGVEADSTQGSDQLLLAHKLQELLEVASSRKESECEHLRGVIRDLSTSRVEAIRHKVLGMESYSRLQDDHIRCFRAAQLANQVARQNFSKAATRQKRLTEVEDALHRQKGVSASLQQRAEHLKAENEALQQRLAALESMQQQPVNTLGGWGCSVQHTDGIFQTTAVMY